MMFFTIVFSIANRGFCQNMKKPNKALISNNQIKKLHMDFSNLFTNTLFAYLVPKHIWLNNINIKTNETSCKIIISKMVQKAIFNVTDREFHHIIQYLSLREIVNFLKCCKQLQIQVQNNIIYRLFLVQYNCCENNNQNISNNNNNTDIIIYNKEQNITITDKEKIMEIFVNDKENENENKNKNRNNNTDITIYDKESNTTITDKEKIMEIFVNNKENTKENENENENKIENNNADITIYDKEQNTTITDEEKEDFDIDLNTNEQHKTKYNEKWKNDIDFYHQYLQLKEENEEFNINNIQYCFNMNNNLVKINHQEYNICLKVFNIKCIFSNLGIKSSFIYHLIMSFEKEYNDFFIFGSTSVNTEQVLKYPKTQLLLSDNDISDLTINKVCIFFSFFFFSFCCCLY